MAEKSWKSKIIDMYKSEEYINLLGYYREQGLLHIMKNSRSEDDHSRFIAWLLDTGCDHGMGKEPADYFLRLLMERPLEDSENDLNNGMKTFDEISDDILLGNWVVDIVKCKTQQQTEEGNRIDILLEVSLVSSDEKRLILQIIKENKIYSDLHKSNTKEGEVMQTEDYYNWAIKTYDNSEKYIRPVFVLWLPSKEDNKNDAQHYRKIDYQDFMDYVLDPIMRIKDDSRIIQYARCLSGMGIEGQYIKFLKLKGKKGWNVVLAQTNEEKELLRKFLRSNFDLILEAVKRVDNTEKLKEALNHMKENDFKIKE